MITARIPRPTILCHCLIVAAIAAGSVSAASQADQLPEQPAAPATALYQLRVYQLFAPSKALFHKRFRDHAMRIMRRHGFDIAATWEGQRDGKPEFIYLLRWLDQAAKDRAWRAFMGDAEWQEIKAATVSPDAPIMDGIEDHAMALTEYSPRFAPGRQ
jgi:hypothetical protein